MLTLQETRMSMAAGDGQVSTGVQAGVAGLLAGVIHFRLYQDHAGYSTRSLHNRLF